MAWHTLKVITTTRILFSALMQKTVRFFGHFRINPSLGINIFRAVPVQPPTFYDQKIYLLGHEGPLFCLEAKTGKVIWQKHLVNDFGGRCPTWGYAGAPLVVDGRVVLQTGAESGSLIALDAQTGNKNYGLEELLRLVTQHPFEKTTSIGDSCLQSVWTLHS